MSDGIIVRLMTNNWKKKVGFAEDWNLIMAGRKVWFIPNISQDKKGIQLSMIT